MSDDRTIPASAARPQRRLLYLLPLIAFAALAAVFAYALNTGDPSRLPSALIGKPVPKFALPPLEGLKAGPGSAAVPGFNSEELGDGQVSIVNVWASWCGPCIAEHPHLVALVRDSGAPLYGINYKDKPEEARRFLGRYGNPYVAVGVDAQGRTAIDWGVYGVPETFIVNKQGQIVYKHVGPLTPEAISAKVMPMIKAAGAAR